MSFLKKVPGFRSSIWWKSLIAISFYFLLFLIIIVTLSTTTPSLDVEDIKPSNRGSISIKGKTIPNKTVELISSNETIQSIESDSDGKFVFPINDLSEGDYAYLVKICNDRCVTKNISIIIDQTSPEKPIISNIDNLPDNDWEEIKIEGFSEPNSIVNVSYADLDDQVVKTDNEGNFSFSTNLSVGGHLLSLKSIDSANNESEVVTTTINFNPIKTKAIVYRVVDGDTIKIDEGKISVRYIGIDTPETVHPSKPVECYGKEASNKNKELVEGKEVILEKDISETDKYGRLLRYVWIDNTLINEVLVQKGYAKSSTYPPDVKYQSRFIEAQNQARDNNRGLWSTTCNDLDKSNEVIEKTTTTYTAPIIAPSTTKSVAPVVTTAPPTTSTGTYICNCSKACTKIPSCDEAYYQLDTCGCSQRDGDDDGVPCEDICPGG